LSRPLTDDKYDARLFVGEIEDGSLCLNKADKTADF